MIIVDINSLPDGVDINIWYALYEKNLVIYDSKKNCIQPLIVDDDLTLVDFNESDIKVLDLVQNAVNEISEESIAKFNETREKFKKNNEALIEYLRKINNNEL